MQLKKAIYKRNKLLRQYKSFENLKEAHRTYKRLRQSKSKESIHFQKGHAAYMKYMRLSKTIMINSSNNSNDDGEQKGSNNEQRRENGESLGNNNDIEMSEIHGEEENLNRISDVFNDESDQMDVDLNQISLSENCCSNCKREQHGYYLEKFGNASPYHLSFTTKTGDEIRNRKFKHHSIVTGINSIEYLFCEQCSNYLTLPTGYNDEAYCWPSFYIQLLEDATVLSKYSRGIWRVVPTEFRYWWINYLQNELPNIYNNITIERPTAFFQDITNDLANWREKINTNELPDLAQICDELLIPSVLCPWGESVFPHKCGTLAIDIVIQRYIQYCEIKLFSDAKKLSRVNSTRDDYFRKEGDIDTWLLNPHWTIEPSIAILDGKVKVLTCKDHDNGTKDFMVHTCRTPHCLPCQQPDQLAQVVVKSRTIRQGKASAYSNEWQMFEQRGNFSGLDTCNHVEYGNFENRSLLRYQNENRSIQNRYDINAHLDTLCRHKIISSEMVKDMRYSAEQDAIVNDYSELYKGATYIPLKNAIEFQDDATSRTFNLSQNIQDANSELQQSINLKFQRYWPRFLYPCQKYSDYGCAMILIPTFRGGLNTKLVWQMASLFTQVEEVWNVAINNTKSSDNWTGWLLTYFTQHCTHVNIKPSKLDPFKLNQIRTIPRIIQKIPQNKSLLELLNEVENIKCIETNDLGESNIDMLLLSSIQDEDNIVVISTEGALECSYNDANYLSDVTLCDGIDLELRCIISTQNIEANAWKGNMFSRHGCQFKKYWFQDRQSKATIRKQPGYNFMSGREYILVYVKVFKDNFRSLQNKYINLIGGQSHIICEVHEKPLVVCYDKEMKCINCKKRSKYCCDESRTCHTICQGCFAKYNIDTVTCLIVSNDSNENSDNEEDYDLEEVVTNDDEEEIIAHYVTRSEDNELLVDDNELRCDDTTTVEEMVSPIDFIPTTNAGEMPIEVEEKVNYGFKFSGSNILNNAGTLLTRKKHVINQNRYVAHYCQKLCSTANCECIPILYPEAMLFPSIHWKACSTDLAVLGAIPSSLLQEKINQHGFASIQQHIRTRLVSPFSTTNSDPRYITHCYDVMANLAASKSDTRLIINRGLTVSSDKNKSLEVRGINDSSLLGSVDSKQMVKNLCTSQKYISWSYFLTFTANQSRHFGLRRIRKWIEKKGWKDTYPKYKLMSEFDQTEIDNSINQAASGLMLRIWEEVSQLFLEFITKSPHSPFKRVHATFSRREYQSFSGNLSHAHIILAIHWSALTTEEREFVKNLAKGSIFDVVKSEDIEKYKEMRLISSSEDVHKRIEDGALFLTHRCNNRCMVKNNDGTLRCRLPKYIHLTPDCTRPHFIDLPVTISDECWDRLNKIDVANSVFNEKKERNVFKCTINFFHPKRWIPAVVPTELPISPYESQTFCVCQSMQNCQRLDQAGGCCKYTCKYLAKIDKQNFVKISMNKDNKGGLVTQSTYLHNTKVTTSDVQQEKEKEKEKNFKHPEGRCISLTEMLHVMLRYPEVYTDLCFVSISTLPLELRCVKQISTDEEVNDGVFVESESSFIRESKPNLPNWRKHSLSEKLLMNDLKQSKMGYDKVVQFSLRPLELKPVIEKIGQYYRWFNINMKKKRTGEEMNQGIHDDIKQSIWIDGLQRQVKLRKNAINEIREWCNSRATANDNVEGRSEVLGLFDDIFQIVLNPHSNHQHELYKHIHDNLIEDDSAMNHLPIPVYSFLRPSQSLQFINHILLSMGSFNTEIDMMTKPSLRDCLRCATLIGDSDREDDLRKYSNALLLKYIKEQVRYFPNSMKTTCEIIVMTGIVFDSIIIKDEIPITDMPPVQYSILMRSIREDIVKERRLQLENLIDAASLELGSLTVQCNIPSKEQLMKATIDQRVQWNPITSFIQGESQSDDSYLEQKFAIKQCKEAIDKYIGMGEQLTMTKSIGIRGHPGAGKTFCMLYILMYAISQGLFCLTSAKMSHRSLQLGGINWDKLLCLRGNETKISPYRRAELAIARLEKNERKRDIVINITIIFADEMGQLSAEEFAIYDIILRHVRKSSLFFGGILIIGTLDHMQIQPIGGRPFLISSSIIPCFKMISLKTSVRAIGDLYVELQSLVRKDFTDFERNPRYIERFRYICATIFTFVTNWTHSAITSQTFRVFTKKAPVRDALKLFQSSLVQKHIGSSNTLRIRRALDTQKSQYSHEWVTARDDVKEELNRKCREPDTLMFERGLTYTITFNDHVKSNSQKAILYELPSQEALDNFASIKVLLAPPGCKEVLFYEDVSKEYYLNKGFKEVNVECSPQRVCNLSNYVQCMRKQYGMQHYVAGTVHSVMGDTLPSIATTISTDNRNFSMWDKGQLLVLISRTKEARNTIFVGEKDETLKALESILKTRTQWTDYMENVLKCVTINREQATMSQLEDSERYDAAVLNHSTYPYRICDISLPIDCSGYVYMLISLRSHDFVYIGKTKDLNARLRSHQSGYGSRQSQPEHLRPYAYFAYICGFDGNEMMMFYIEKQWKEMIQRLIRQGINNPTLWAERGGNDVLNLRLDNFGVRNTRSELRLVLLFK